MTASKPGLHRAGLVLLAVLMVLAGCGSPGPDEPAGPPETTATPKPGDGAEPESKPEPTPTRTLTLEARCAGSDSDTDTDTDTDDGDAAPQTLTDLAWQIPAGFTTAGGYRQISPAEGDHHATYLVPEAGGATLDVIAVVHYPQLDLGPVTDECGALDPHMVQERLDAYLARVDAERVEGVRAESVGGAQAFVEVLDYAADGFALRAVWIYGQEDLVHIGCQWTRDRETIEAACDELLASVTIGT